MDSQPRLAAPEEDRVLQSAVLLTVLLSPSPLTREELKRELGTGEDFAAQDDFERAIRDLTGVGLLNQEGETIWPTRAARAFHEIESS